MFILVCAFVCGQNNSKPYGQILMTFSGNVEDDTRNTRFNIDGDPEYYLRPRLFKEVLGHGGNICYPNTYVLIVLLAVSVLSKLKFILLLPDLNEIYWYIHTIMMQFSKNIKKCNRFHMLLWSCNNQVYANGVT